MKKLKKDLDFLKGIYIAHRGLHNNEAGIPENSLLAFKEALKLNMPVEFDLHLLKDGNIAVFHDDNLNRMTGCDKDIKNCTYNEIKDLKLLDTDERIPLFEDVLKLAGGKVLLDIEFKSDFPAGNLESKACEYLDNYNGDFVVKSFDPFSVRWFKKNRPDFVRGQLACNFAENKTLSSLKKFICRNMLVNIITNPDFIAYELQSMPNKKVAKYRKKKYPILIWTVRSDEDLKNSEKYGDSFIYENIIINSE